VILGIYKVPSHKLNNGDFYNIPNHKRTMLDHPTPNYTIQTESNIGTAGNIQILVLKYAPMKEILITSIDNKHPTCI
jgi:hypothetical protein